MDEQWSSSVAENWHGQHMRLQAMVARRSELEGMFAQDQVGAAEQWEYVQLLEELDADQDLLSHVERVLAQDAAHIPALYMRGRLNLARGNDAGITDVAAAMEADADAILPGCELLWRYFLERDPERAQGYASRWEQRNDYLTRLREEANNLPGDARLVAPELPAEAMEEIAHIVRSNSLYIRRAWLLKRVFKTDEAVCDYVLAFEVSPWSFGDNSGDVVQRLVKKEFPMPLFVVPLKSATYKGFRKTIKKLKLAPIYAS